jgi:hypothetical protein
VTLPVINEQRGSRRVAVALDVHLGRKVGNDVIARAHDLSISGACVVSARPLRVDEELRFDLELPVGGPHLSGTVRVVRQHRPDMYALRFESVAASGRGVLGEFVEASSGSRAG